MSERAKGLSRQQMCNRLAMEFGDGWIVNLGIGIPTLCSNFDFGDKEIIFHSENGVIGYGPLAATGKEDLHLVNAGGQHVTLRPGAAIVHHADSFALIRAGRLDATVLGAYEVAENGDFANWKLAGQQGGGIGGAMDLAACAKLYLSRWSIRRAMASRGSSSAARSRRRHAVWLTWSSPISGCSRSQGRVSLCVRSLPVSRSTKSRRLPAAI